MSSTVTYAEVPAAEVPSGLRWNTPKRHQGQAVETQYACPGAADEANHGDLWMRVTDHSDGSTWYYKRA